MVAAIGTPLRIQTSASRFRIADIALLDPASPATRITTHPPLAVFEILSPEDRVQRLTRTLRRVCRDGNFRDMGG
jgi:hypothetical protein